MSIRNKQPLVFLCILIWIAGVMSGCSLDLSGPVYTKDSIPIALHQYGITAHYPSDQGSGQLLPNATGQRYLLQIDSIDKYRLQNGWVEVYLYPDAEKAYQEALAARKAYDERFRDDQKMVALQGKKLVESPFPLFQHGNVIVFGEGIANDPTAIKRITKMFGQYGEGN